jgi:hypothetical protein
VNRMPNLPSTLRKLTKKRASMWGTRFCRTARSLLAGVIAIGVIVLFAVPSEAQTARHENDADRRVQQASPQRLPAPKVELRAKDTVEHTFVRPRVAIRGSGGAAEKAFTPATFVVTYTGFSEAAEDAFQAAVDVWSQLISSPVTIRVDAVWEPLGAGILGSAGSHSLWVDVPNGVPGVVYPDALADALNGSDVGGGDFDIDASFNSTFADWYFGTDGNPPGGKWDLMSVVLHELGHGLGFLGSPIVDNGAGPAECDGVAGHGCWQLGATFPVIFDLFADDNLGIAIRDAGTYPNNSVALGNVLRSMDVFFDGTNANIGNGGSPAELYAPGSWDQGSSFSHLDETVFAAGNPSSLMTPFLGSAEAIHDPGPVTLGIFEDIGWEVGGGIFTDGFESGNTSAWNSTVGGP